jgi:hypothetical protein
VVLKKGHELLNKAEMGRNLKQRQLRRKKERKQARTG